MWLSRMHAPAADAAVRDEILLFLASQEELDEFQQTQIAGLWEQQADCRAASGDRASAAALWARAAELAETIKEA